MPITTMTSRDFKQRATHAKRAATRGPVFITDRGRAAYVLLAIDDYRKLAGARPKITDLLAMPGLADIELPLPARTDRPRVIKID